jgi:flagellar FliL protein
MILGSDVEEMAHEGEMDDAPVAELPPVAFVALDPLVISLGDRGSSQHLRFRASLEVNPEYEDDVQELTPRVLDVLNSYLRAVDVHDLEEPTSLVNLRAQMLRRIQLVTGEGRVRDLLVMEFVLN